MPGPRVLIGGIWHETNTFSPVRTTRADFEQTLLATGGDLLTNVAGTGSELGGVVEAASAHGCRLVPSLFAKALPSGPVSNPAYRQMKNEILADARRAAWDGAVLALHGAMVVEGLPDPEGDLLASLRSVAGTRPMVATLDLHGNVTPQMVAAADVLMAYKTYPHIDMADRGHQALELTLAMLQGDAELEVAGGRVRLVPDVPTMATEELPMAPLMERVRYWEAKEGVVSVSLLPGFPYADVSHAGMTIIVAVDAARRKGGAGGQAAAIV